MSSQEVAPSLEELRKLYDVAVQFRDLGCWEWMYDSQLFGVHDPVHGDTGFCAVMGNAGEHFALAVYLGAEGLLGYFKMASQGPRGDPGELLMSQQCLMASFEDRGMLEKKDLDTIKQLGLKFRGRNAWPLFRSYRPGYFPWHVTRDEARFLTTALEQAIDVGSRLREDPELLTPPEPGLYLMRVPDEQGGAWRDTWGVAVIAKPEGPESPPVDEERLRRLRGTLPRGRTVWEVDCFHFPGTVKGEEDERPYYPHVMLCVDQAMGVPLGIELLSPEEWPAAVPEKLLDLIEKMGQVPGEILINRPEVEPLLRPLTLGLGTRLRSVRRLKVLEPLRKHLFTYFER